MPTLADPLFTATGGQRLSLFDLFATIADGQPLELNRLRPHQRAPVVTALAILMTALRRHASGPLTSHADWAREWRGQIGADALRLLAPVTEVAFFQPPLEPRSRQVHHSDLLLSDIDLTFTRALHAAKPVDDGTAEEAVFALLAGTWKISVVKWTAGTRQCPVAALPSADATLGGEVRHLAMAYDQHTSTLIGSQAMPSRAADHCLWLRPVMEASLTLDALPYPYLEARPIHLVETRPGRYAGIGQQLTPRRIAGKGHAEDPQVPLIGGAPYVLWGARVWGMATQHEALFGSSRTQRPTTLDLPGYRAVRLCGVGTDQGKTLGFWEELYSLTPQAAFTLAASPQRGADLSQRALEIADQADRALRWAIAALLPGSAESAAIKAAKGRASLFLKEALTAPLTATVLALLAAPAGLVAEQVALQTSMVKVLRTVWRKLSSGCPDPLAVALGTDRLEFRIRDMTGEDSMTSHPDLPLSRQVFAILQDLSAHQTPDDRAQLRTMLPSAPPLIYWVALSQVPDRLSDSPALEAVWRALLPALGTLRPAGAPLGQVLARTDYPELRFRQLLAATGETLVAQSAEVVRWLIAHEQNAVDLAALTAYALADALGDDDTRAVLQRQLALDYVRANRPLKEAA